MDTTLLVFGGVSAGLVYALHVAARRAVTIAELRIEAGELRVVRGGLLPSVLSDLRDVTAEPPIRALRVRIFRSSGRAEIELGGDVSPEQAQQIRNVIGNVPLARLMSGPRR